MVVSSLDSDSRPQDRSPPQRQSKVSEDLPSHARHRLTAVASGTSSLQQVVGNAQPLPTNCALKLCLTVKVEEVLCIDHAWSFNLMHSSLLPCSSSPLSNPLLSPVIPRPYSFRKPGHWPAGYKHCMHLVIRHRYALLALLVTARPGRIQSVPRRPPAMLETNTRTS